MTTGATIRTLVVVAGLLGACLQRPMTVAPGPDRRAALEAEAATLRAEAAQLRAENTRLAAQVEGAPRWQAPMQLARVGARRGLVPYVRICPQDTLLIGFRGTSGALVDSLIAVCAGPSGGGTARPGTPIELDVVGGGQGSPFERLCPEGSAVVGAHGRAGDAVDAVGVVCGPLAGGDDANPELDPVGGTSGAPWERFCPSGTFAAGLTGTYFEQVESLSLLCVAPGDAAASEAAPAPAEAPSPTTPGNSEEGSP